MTGPGAGPDAVVTAKERAQVILHRLVPGRGICNIGVAIRLESSAIRWWPLRQALNALANRHPALRTAVADVGGTPYRRYREAPVTVPLTGGAATDGSLDGLLTTLMERPFDLDRELLFRAHLAMLPGAGVICLTFHHLVADHGSVRVLLRELTAFYDALAEHDRPPTDLAAVVPPLLESDPDADTVGYWTSHLKGVDPTRLPVAGARPDPERPTFAGARQEYDFRPAGVAALNRLTRLTRTTPNIVLLAAFYLLLARHGGGPDLVIGVPVNARDANTADAVGFHASTLPVRVLVDEMSTVAELIRSVRTAFVDGLEHRTASFEAVAAELGARSGSWRTPLFRHMFNFRPSAGDGDLSMAGEPVRVMEMYHGMSRLDLEWIAFGGGDGVRIVAVHSTEIHDGDTVRRMLERYEAQVVEMATGVDRALAGISGWSRADVVATRRLDDTAVDTDARPLLRRIHDQARLTPNATALVDGDEVVTFAGLVAAAEEVRRELVRRGVTAADTVALWAARGAGLAAAALGVWAAGACYLPLDPSHPPRRLSDQLDDAGVRLIVSPTAPDERCLTGRAWFAPPAAGRGVPADLGWSWPGADDIAYVIYTSGSTGRPKGVEVTQANLANLVGDFATRLGMTSTDRVLWLTTFSFDISALELYLPLVTGGVVVVASDADRVEPRRVLDLIGRERVTVVQATPTTWRQFGGDFGGRLRGIRVLSGGEPLTASLANDLLAGGCRLYNVYGPTETTIWSTMTELTMPVSEPVPVGEPIANTLVRIRATSGGWAPPGVPGELCIGGRGVARGYRARPELTADRFREDPGIGRYYRTGDTAVQTPDGLILSGRMDRQVKVRGHRVELGEVEAVLASHPGVLAAVVLPERDGLGHQRLVAAVQPTDPGGTRPPSPDELREYLARRLPPAVVPSRLLMVPRLPTTGNGKVDYAGLALSIQVTDPPAERPADPLLSRLVTLWCEVLDDETVAVDGNFFMHGGHSLLAVELATRLGAEFGITVDFDVIFEAPTPSLFRSWLRQAEPGADRRDTA